MRRRLLALLFAGAGLGALGTATAFGQQGYRVEEVGTAAPGVAEAIGKALQPQGARLVSSEGKTIAELWLRTSLPLQGSVREASYGALAEGTLVGVLNFPQGGSDFRGQTIQQGAYTLRYERLPQDGNHLGAAPESHFLLLCPAAADQQLDASFNFDSLAELSRQASRTNHPAPLMLMTVSGTGEFPGIERNDLGHVALRVRPSAQEPGSLTPQDFPIAIVLVGKAEL